MNTFISSLSVMLTMLISVAYITLLERKILGIIQARKGPNTVGWGGITQPLADAIKLLQKESPKLKKVDLIMYNLMPIGMMILAISVLMFLPSSSSDSSSKFSLLMILSILSTAAFPITMGSWFSGSSYSQLSAIRAIAQMISYEVSLMILVTNLSVMASSFSLEDFKYGLSSQFMQMTMTMIMITIVAELNRTPMDLIEGESELVSGFNTEYFSFKFTMIFVSEYMMIMSLSMFMTWLTFPAESMVFTLFVSMLTMTMILWLRGVLPRIRYDELMYFCWMVILPLSAAILLLSINMTTMIKLV